MPTDPRETSHIARAAAVLSAFTFRDSALTAAELARRAGLPRSSAHRIVADLVAEGLLERAPQGGFCLGMRLFELGLRAPRQRGLRDVAAPFLTDLRDATRQTVHLAVLDGTEVVYLDIIRSSAGPALRSRVGGRLPASVTGVGKAILAFSPAPVRQAMIARGLPRLTRHSITDAAVLTAQLDSIAQRNTAYDRQEQAYGTSCCASAIFGYGGDVIGAVSVAGHTSTLRLENVASAVRSTAAGVSRMYGGHVPR
ncbi:IclR family transcriptional regulator [Xylanimonas allomyrinae]|uniref:Glycerol operon regulatory protein n=1 Tax=Xylanimonas allomyrinae TaxID=2509459 RepID=A0A4P6EIT6_9MICO|nr:IclR family transcriptional regulator [Xylanimonas allomyrinae]QAY62205.1 IclR family transcriptional regulator [Xylanimonas allomyrinae]